MVPQEVFVQVAKDAGVDGFIIVDIPAEADDELCIFGRPPVPFFFFRISEISKSKKRYCG